MVYPRRHVPKALTARSDEENGSVPVEKAQLESSPADQSGIDRADRGIIQRQTAIFSWKDVVYDIKIKSEARRILDHIDGWVKPGTLTALMGVSGAGKTTLLDVLATRVTMGVVTGEMLVDGYQRDASFQRKTGYVQQQDLHLQTSTVREALRFSALLRQPRHVSYREKVEYVEEVLKLLEMDTYADAVVGVPGEGLNVEQRKRLTIAVELVAKPELLLFLDEPTSGLDSQTSWNILRLLRKLTAHGQAILCTIHQPSAILFEQFDRLLFLAKGGKTVYFGEVGKGSHVLIDYFIRNGAFPCREGENPAEWMLQAIGAAPGSHTDIDWHATWMKSPEWREVRRELEHLKVTRPREAEAEKAKRGEEEARGISRRRNDLDEFAAPIVVQFYAVLLRVFQQYWRTPSYIWAKIALCVFSVRPSSRPALTHRVYSSVSRSTKPARVSKVFKTSSSRSSPCAASGTGGVALILQLFTIFSQLVQQIMPNFVIQRGLYEVRERPAKIYSWKVFILSNIVAEVPYSGESSRVLEIRPEMTLAVVMGTVVFVTWYYPIGFYQNAIPTNAVAERGALMWLYTECFLLFSSTFATAMVAGIELAETAGNLANLLFSLSLVFCG